MKDGWTTAYVGYWRLGQLGGDPLVVHVEPCKRCVVSLSDYSLDGVTVVARLPCVRMHTSNANNILAMSAESGKALGASATVHLTFQIRGAVAATRSQINQP